MTIAELEEKNIVCLRLAGAFAKFQIAPLYLRHTKEPNLPPFRDPPASLPVDPAEIHRSFEQGEPLREAIQKQPSPPCEAR